METFLLVYIILGITSGLVWCGISIYVIIRDIRKDGETNMCLLPFLLFLVLFSTLVMYFVFFYWYLEEKVKIYKIYKSNRYGQIR